MKIDKIELVSYGTPDERKRGVFVGWKHIVVDGVVWGVIVSHCHARNGTVYQIKQDTRSPKLAEVWSDGQAFKQYLWGHQMGRDVPRPAKLEVRLRTEVARLIIERKLRSPKTIQEEIEAARQRDFAARKRRTAQRRARMAAKARVLLGRVTMYHETDRIFTRAKELEAIVVEAMEYARTHY